MITREQAIAARHGASTIHYTGRHLCTRVVGPRGGVTETITRVRASGRCQTWKTRPDDFRLPVKFGLYESNEITQSNADAFHVEADCPLVSEQSARDEALRTVLGVDAEAIIRGAR